MGGKELARGAIPTQAGNQLSGQLGHRLRGDDSGGVVRGNWGGGLLGWRAQAKPHVPYASMQPDCLCQRYQNITDTVWKKNCYQPERRWQNKIDKYVS